VQQRPDRGGAREKGWAKGQRSKYLERAHDVKLPPVRHQLLGGGVQVREVAEGGVTGAVRLRNTYRIQEAQTEQRNKEREEHRREQRRARKYLISQRRETHTYA
jgi:hypothetical protein